MFDSLKINRKVFTFKCTTFSTSTSTYEKNLKLCHCLDIDDRRSTLSIVVKVHDLVHILHPCLYFTDWSVKLLISKIPNDTEYLFDVDIKKSKDSVTPHRA